jgi:alcohol dehydrogenase YqhD (iron-dependent ADH family)
LPDKPSPTLRSPQYMRWPIQSVDGFTFPTARPSRWFYPMSCDLTCLTRLTNMQRLRLTFFPELATVHVDERASALIDAMENLIREVGLPTSLEAVGIAEICLDDIADEAMQQTRLLVNNPRPVTRQDALRIFQQAYR